MSKSVEIAAEPVGRLIEYVLANTKASADHETLCVMLLAHMNSEYNRGLADALSLVRNIEAGLSEGDGIRTVISKVAAAIERYLTMCRSNPMVALCDSVPPRSLPQSKGTPT